MDEQPYLHNELSGDVGGPVVQAGHIHGDVVMPATAPPISPEQAELRRRLDARARRILDAEDAEREAAARRQERFLRATHLRKWVSMVVMLASLFAAIVSTSALGDVFALLFGLVGLGAWFSNVRILKRHDWKR
ncbi:hypothetical protein [Streptomyces sp. XD-27]|uniref:hypothetical protein n=1 Tax=Streptomyces sp. XD-27 TaxID=3062779 RepID=UPI0026F432B7|nr:hypothetical protein [Streptomyces sp. XD-27]WKX73818.1 hypothetical protein Q3Y56_31625 [Streptomyces sp. XD-27]